VPEGFAQVQMSSRKQGSIWNNHSYLSFSRVEFWVMIGAQLAVSELKYFFCFLGYMGEVGCVRVRGKGNTFNLWFERLSMIFSFATFII
jgi:hypothetical protein